MSVYLVYMRLCLTNDCVEQDLAKHVRPMEITYSERHALLPSDYDPLVILHRIAVSEIIDGPNQLNIQIAYSPRRNSEMKTFAPDDHLPRLSGSAFPSVLGEISC